LSLWWIVCLLLGPVSSSPLLQKRSGDSGSNPMWDYWFRNSGGTSDPGGSPGSSLSKPASDQPSGLGRSSIIYAGDSYDGGGPYRYAQGSSTEGQQVGKVLVGHPDDGEFFTDTADLDPVYSFNSRSRYQRGRAVFSQTRYTPTTSLEQPYDYHSKSAIKGGPKGPGKS
uniref:Uncharacterized protein n=1 Tax=Salarias fasciatus TaxID=181472 RepID=A0A672FCI0_SALFA